MKICNHCRHHKVKYLNGVKVSERCAKILNPNFDCLECYLFSRSLKSRLRLVKELEDD